MPPSYDPLDEKNFRNFTLRKIIPYNHNSAKFIFDFPANDDTFTFLPVASHVTIKASDPTAVVDAHGLPRIRLYSPLHPPAGHTARELVLLVKRYEKGNISKHIFSLKEGDVLSIKGPDLKYPYKINQFAEVAFIGGGTGIAPFFQILSHALPDPANTTHFTLLYSNVSEADILLRHELDALAHAYPLTFKLVYVLDNAPASAAGMGEAWAGEAGTGTRAWTGPTGYISAEHVRRYVPPPVLGEKLKIFVCGPPPQVVSLAGRKDGPKQGVFGGILKDLGYAESQVYKF